MRFLCHMVVFIGFLVDRFGEYKPVVITALILNAAFHHSLLLIPHQETPGVMPSAYVMRHPITNSVEVRTIKNLFRNRPLNNWSLLVI